MNKGMDRVYLLSILVKIMISRSMESILYKLFDG